MSLRLPKILLVLTALLATLVPALPSAAAPVTEVRYVPTTLADGTTEQMRVEIRRDTTFDEQGQGFIMTMSPYNLTPTGTGVGAPTIPGIAMVQADVLGTRGSTGCWDYGGVDEQQAGVDVVRFLAGDIADENGDFLTYSNGRVGMTGVSYDGTTANMVAGAAPEMWGDSYDPVSGETPLKAIVPIAAIAHWYGYAYAFGMRMTDDGESTSPTDEDILTPLAFDLGFGLTVHQDQLAREDTDGVRGCGTVEHTLDAYSRNPDYTDFWQSRDYTTNAATWSTNTLIVHGWNDYNVKQYEAMYLYDALAPYADDPSTPESEGFDLRVWMTQARHANGNGDVVTEDGETMSYAQVRDTFWRANLLTQGSGDQMSAAASLGTVPPVRSLGETRSGAADVITGETIDDIVTSTQSFFLNRTYEQDLPDNGIPVDVPGPGTGEVGELSYSNAPSGPLDGRSGSYGPTSGWVDTGLTGEELATRDPWSNDGQKLDVIGGQGYYSLNFATNPLTRSARIFGSARLEGYFNYLHGIIYSQKNLTHAEKYYKKALKLGLTMDYDVAMAKLSLAGIAMQKRRKREATQLLQEAKKLDKNNMLTEQIKMMQQQMKKI